MNPLIKSYLDQIHGAADDLAQTLAQHREQLDQQTQTRDRYLQQYWSQKKESATLADMREAYERLAEENERLRKAQAELETRLHRVLGYTKALVGSFRP